MNPTDPEPPGRPSKTKVLQLEELRKKITAIRMPDVQEQLRFDERSHEKLSQVLATDLTIDRLRDQYKLLGLVTKPVPRTKIDFAKAIAGHLIGIGDPYGEDQRLVGKLTDTVKLKMAWSTVHG